MSARCLALLLALSTSGCALNSALEIEMDLPWADGDLPRARVQVCGADCAFDDEWARDAEVFPVTPEMAECETGGSCNVRFSVLTEQADLERLLVRVRFCDDDCDVDVPPPDAPELWFELEEPFQPGRRTYWNPSAEPFVRIPAEQPDGQPASPIRVPKCEIRDECWQPADRIPDATFGYCNMAGERFCEAGN
jgi:hypothetical protein